MTTLGHMKLSAPIATHCPERNALRLQTMGAKRLTGFTTRGSRRNDNGNIHPLRGIRNRTIQHGNGNGWHCQQ